MSLIIFESLEQGSSEWLQARCGIVTASTIGQLITTKTLKPAVNDTARSLTLSLAAERMTGRVEPTATTRDMERGNLAEPYARAVYAGHTGQQVDEVGFMRLDHGHYKLGYSPDGMVGEDGLIEIKSPRAKKHVRTILDGQVPPEYMAQCQTGLYVSGREWLDFISYNAGMPLFIKRVFPDPRWVEAIDTAAERFELESAEILHRFAEVTADSPATDYIDFFADEDIF